MGKFYKIDEAVKLELNTKDFAWLAIANKLQYEGVHIDYVKNKPFIMSKSILEILKSIGLFDEYKDLRNPQEDVEEESDRDYWNNLKWDSYNDAFDGDSSNYWNID